MIMGNLLKIIKFRSWARLNFHVICGISIAFTTLIYCDDEQRLPPVSETNIIITMADNQELSTFMSALGRADLMDSLAFYTPFTVFAPTNEAFVAAGLEIGLIPTDSLQEMMLYHILQGRYLTDFFGNDSIPTLLDSEYLRFRVNNSNFTINGNANIVNGNIEAINGMIHVVDQVLIPE